MPRVKRGTKRRQRRKKILERASGYFLTKSKLYRAAKESVERGLKFAYSGRKQKKRQYRSIWIVRIGAASRAQGISYNQFISGLKKAGVEAHRHLVEFRGRSELVLGESVTVEAFEAGDSVKVSGLGIGKGFAGTIKRHQFHRGPKTHGSHNIRKPGSIGASATPSRVFKGMKMAGRMGGKRVTQTGLTVHSIDAERNLLLVKGSVPGPKNGVVEVREMSS